MISELLGNLYESFVSFRGDGKIIILILVALLFLYLIRDKFDFNPFTLILSPIAGIGVACGKILDTIKSKWILLLTGILLVIGIVLSGGYIFSSERVELSDNIHHIPGDYVEVMDYILSLSDNPKVLAMPDYSIYHSVYSSKFDMLYEQRLGDDVRYLPDNARIAFGELSKTSPDMYMVSSMAMESGCDFIVIKKDYYWCELPLYHFHYEVIKSFDNWDVYARKGMNYE